MQQVFTKAMARNIFLGGAVFFSSFTWRLPMTPGSKCRYGIMPTR